MRCSRLRGGRLPHMVPSESKEEDFDLPLREKFSGGMLNDNNRRKSSENCEGRKMKAVVSITLDDEFVVHDIKVIEGEKGLFIAMPSRKAADGEYRDIAHPINSTTRERIQSMILQEYERAVTESPEEEMEA